MQWDESDCMLTSSTVSALVAAHDLDRVRFVGEGWDSWVYAAMGADGGEWMVRFPKRGAVAVGLRREMAILPELAPMLPLAVPRFDFVGGPARDYPHCFVAYRRLRGRPAIEIPDVLEKLAPWAQLGRFLGALHGFSMERAAQLGIERDDTTDDERAAEAQRQLEAAGERVSAAARRSALRILESPLDVATGPVLIHSDFAPEHVLVDGGAISGVIDWGDVALGDPAIDFGGIYYAGGDDAVATALAEYAPSPTARARLAARARFIGVCRAAGDLEYGVATDRHDYTAAALRALDRLID